MKKILVIESDRYYDCWDSAVRTMAFCLRRQAEAYIMRAIHKLSATHEGGWNKLHETCPESTKNPTWEFIFKDGSIHEWVIKEEG